MIFGYLICTYIFSIVQLDPQIPIIPEIPNERIPSPVDGEPIWDSEESTFNISSPVATSTPALSFINGKQEVTIEPEKSYAEKEARGDVFESVSSTLQNLTQTEEKVEISSNFDYSLVDTGATQDGSLESNQDITYPMPIFFSTVEPKFIDKEPIIVESTPPSSLLPDPENETIMEEGFLIPNTPSGITVERSFSPKPYQPSAFPTNPIATSVAPSKPIDTTEEISHSIEDGSGQETATIQVMQMTQENTTFQATESDKLVHTTDATSEKKPLLPSHTDPTDITFSATNYWTTESGIKEYAFTTETPMSATRQTGNTAIPDTTEKQAIVTSSPDIETVVLQTKETLIATPSVVNIFDFSEKIFSTQEQHLYELSALSTVHTVEETSKDVPSVKDSETFPFSEADGSGDQSYVMSTTKLSTTTVFPLHTTTHSEQNFTTTALYSVQKVDETVSVKSVSEEMEANQATVSPLAFSSSYIAVETTVKPVQLSDISEEVIQEPFTATVQLVVSAEGSGDQSPDSPAVATMATTVPSKSSDVHITDASKMVFSTESSEKKTTDTFSIESINQSLPSTKSESLLLFPDEREGSGNQITDTFTTTTTSIPTTTMITSHASTTIPAFSLLDGTTIKVETYHTDGAETKKPLSTISSNDVTSVLLHSAPEDEFSGESILDNLGPTSIMPVYSTVTDDHDITTSTTTQIEAKESISTTTTRTFTVYHTQSISKESSLKDIGTTPEYKTESHHNIIYVQTPGTQISNALSKESHMTSAPTQEIPQSEGSGEESGEFEDGISGDFYNTVVESTPPSQPPSTKKDIITTKSETLMGTELPAHPTVMDVSSDFAHSTVMGTIPAFATGDGSWDRNKDTVSVTSPTSVPTLGSSTVTPDHFSLGTSQKPHIESIYNATYLTSTAIIPETLGASSIGQESSIFEESADNMSETTEASKEYSIRTDEAEISYTKSTIDYSDVEMSTLSTKVTSEFTSQIPSISAQTELMSSSSESGSGDTEEPSTETEGADDDGSGDLVSTVLESFPPSVSPIVEHVTMTSFAGIKYEGTVDNKVLIHVKGSEMSTTEVSTEFSMKTEEAETSENKTTLDHLVETSTQYTLLKSESTSAMPSMAVSSDTGSGDMEDTISEGNEDEGTEDNSSGDFIESAAPSQSPSADITTEASVQTSTENWPLVVPTSTFTDSVALTNDYLFQQSTVTTVPMVTGIDSVYMTSKHVDIDSEISTTDVDKGTLKVVPGDGGSGDEMLVTATSELQKSTGVTSLPTERSYTTLVDEASVQASPKSMVTDTDVTTPVLSVIYQDSTDKEVTTVFPSSSEIRSNKITARLHETKSITSPVIIFTEEIKDEDELFSTVTDSMTDHSSKTEIISKDDMIIDADTLSVLEPSSPFASTILTEEAAGITAVTITPQASSILTEEPEGSGTDKPLLQSSDLHLPTQTSLEGTTAKGIDLSSSVKAEETEAKSTFPVDILDIRFTAETVAPSKMIPHLSTSIHSAQTTLYSPHSATLYNTGKSHPSQTTSHITYSTNHPVFTTSASVYTTSHHSPIITAPSHTTTSQPNTILHLTSTTSQSEFISTQTMPMTSDLIDNFSGDSVSVEDSGMQTLKPLSSGSDIIKTTTAHETTIVLHDTAQTIDNGEPRSTMPYVDESLASSTSSIIEGSATAATTDPFFTSTGKFFQSSRPLLSDESSGDMISESVTEGSTAVSFKDSTSHRDFSTTYSDGSVSLSKESDSTTYAPPVVTTSRYYPEVTTTAIPMVSMSTIENGKYTQYTQTTKQGMQLTQEIPIIESNNDVALDSDATAEPSLVESIPNFIDSETFSKPQSEILLESTTVYESMTPVSSTEWSGILDKNPLQRSSTISPIEDFIYESKKEEVTTVKSSSDETSPVSPMLQSYESVTGSVDEENVSEVQETATAFPESTDYTTSSADGIRIHLDTTVSPKDISDDTILVEGSAPNPESLNGTQRPGLNVDLGYTVVGETYDIEGMTFSRPNCQCFLGHLYNAYVLILLMKPSNHCSVHSLFLHYRCPFMF